MAMAKTWRNRIIAGTQIFSKCPERYRSDVLVLLQEDVTSGKITAEKYNELTGEDCPVSVEDTTNETLAE